VNLRSNPPRLPVAAHIPTFDPREPAPETDSSWPPLSGFRREQILEPVCLEMPKSTDHLGAAFNRFTGRIVAWLAQLSRSVQDSNMKIYEDKQLAREIWMGRYDLDAFSQVGTLNPVPECQVESPFAIHTPRGPQWSRSLRRPRKKSSS
jgi:hypothetical protein